MVTGVSFDFHDITISWVSESSQWWQSMAVVVVFGLMVATFLTLLVVPTLYLFLDDLSVTSKNTLAGVQRFAGRFLVALDSSAKS